MNCPSCGEANRDGAKFCISCGTPFALACPSCGAELPAKARFCDSCGQSTDAPPKPAAADVAATRKIVTVVFADLTGSTSIGERMDPEAFRALMGPFYTAMRSEVETRGGVIAKFQGDGVMALFGIPDVREDDAARAIDAAVAMQRAVTELPQRDAVLSLRIGVNTGEVVIGERDEDLVGDTINVAARLEGAAAPGEILVGEEAWRLTRSGAAYEPVAPLALKGKTEPVPAFRLVAVGEQEAEGGTSVFVGRDGEVSRLTAAFEEVIDASAARLVTIVGSPGLGKTRLAREFAGSLADRAVVVETRCEAASSSTFAPVVDALRAGVQIDEAAGPDAIRARVEEIVPATEPERERIVRLVAGLLGAGSPGSTEETFWAIRRMIEIGASNGPIVFVLDDMHWAEPVLLDLIEHLTEYIRAYPVLLVVTGRPELRDIRPSLVEGGRALAVVALEGLDQGSTTRLACELLGGDPVPAELLARLPSSTEGNPLFVRELVRMLVDDGVLQRTDGAWNVTIDVDAITVPPTIHSLLAARVDRLRAEERTILELASVIGREFYRGALLELLPSTLRATLDAHLESLRRKELVEPSGTYWIDEPVFQFHHVLIRDAAYRRLLKGARAEFHEQVARWLEDKTAGLAGEHDEAIGYHLEQAYLSRRQLGPLDDASVDLGRRAAMLLGAEARRALDRDDHPAAAALAGRALEVLDPDDGVRAEPLILRCEALLGMGDVTDGAPAVRELERIATTERLAHWATCFDAELANLTDPARLREIEKRVAAAASALESLGDVGGSAKAHTVHAATLARLGRFAECEDELDHALTAARERGDRGRITAVLGALPQAALWGPHPVSRAGGRCLDVVRLLRITTQSPAVEAISSRCQAVLEALRGRADAARGMLRKARRVQRELGLRHGLLETELAHGIVELVDGDAAAAVEHLKIAHDGFLAMGVDASAAQAAALLGRAYLTMGEEDDAEAFADESERLGGDDVKTAIAWRAVRAEILARRGRIDEARALAERAVELAAATDAVIDHGDAYMALAAVHRASGDTAAAKSAEDRAIALYERKGASALVETRPGAELTSRPQPALQRTGLENACTRAADRFNAAFAERDWKAIGELYSDDVLREDRRVGMRDSMVGRDAFVDRMKGAAEVGVSRSESTVLAIRGERLALRRVIHGSAADPTGFEAEMLTVGELDESGRVCRAIVFDASDLDGAMAELEERFIAGEAAPYAERLRVAVESMRRFNARDWDSWEQTMASGHVFVDHRPASLGEIHGAHGYVEASRTLIELSAKSRSTPVAIHALAANGLIAEIHGDAVMPDGGEFGLDFLALITVSEDRITRTEYFPLDQLDAARTRFAELAERPSPLDNECSRAVARAQALVIARDWHALPATYDDDIVLEDRRRGFSGEWHGIAEVMDVARSIVGVGVERVDVTPIAVRGERLCLERHRFVGERYDAIALSVHELTAEGRLAATVVFDEADLSSAVDELDRRYIAGEGSPFAETIRIAVEFNRRSNARDWAGWEALMHPDHVLVDHRPASLGEVRGASEIVNVTRTMIEFLATSHAVSVDLEAAPGACMSETHVRGETTDGAPIEIELIALMGVRDGLVRRTEYFPLNQREAARTRFVELAEFTSLLENECSRVAQRFDAHCAAREGDAALALNADDILYEDRRKGLADRRVGSQAVMDVNRSITDIGVERMERTPIAVRGERYCLDRLHFVATSFEAFVLRLLELNDDGRFSAALVFDEHDLAGAIAEMDDRYYAGEGAPFAGKRPFIDAMGRGIGHGEWDAFRAAVTSDFVVVDHRPASLGQMGAEEFIEAIDVLRDLVRSFCFFVPCMPAQTPNAIVAQYVTQGISEDGNAIEYSAWTVGVFRDGRAARVELYPSDRLDDALARFNEIEGRERFDELTDADTRSIENDAMRLLRENLDALNARDWERFRTYFTADFRSDDHRPGLTDTIVGADALLNMMRVVEELDIVISDVACVAMRGSRLALAREVGTTTVTGGDYHVEFLSLCELDETGRASGAAAYTPDQLPLAMQELHQRFIEGEGAPFSRALDVGERFIAAVNGRDIDGLRELMSDDCAVTDRRPASLGEMGREEYLASFEALFEVIPDFTYVVRRILAMSTWGSLGEAILRGRSADGTEVEMTRVGLVSVRDDKLTAIEIFPEDQIDQALARFAELDALPLDNDAVRLMRANIDVINARDWDSLRPLFTADFRHEDVRPGFVDVRAGIDEALESVRVLGELDVYITEFTPVATRGSRLALVREVGTSQMADSGFDVEVLILSELDANGRSRRSVTYAPEQLTLALDRLDEWFIQGEGREHAEVLELGRKLVPLIIAQDFDALRAILSDDFVYVDHRQRASLGQTDAEGWFAASVALDDLLDNYRYYSSATHGLTANVTLGEVVWEGTTRDGSEFRTISFGLSVFRDGRIVRIEQFSEEQFDLARARFNELVGAEEQRETLPPLDNEAMRVLRAINEALNARDWDRYVSCLAPDARNEDRRLGLADVQEGVAANLAHMRVLEEMEISVTETTCIATRGSTLALARLAASAGAPGEYDAEFLVLGELDSSGRITRSVIFDADQLSAALVELEERFLAGEGAPFADRLRTGIRFKALYDSYDFDGVRAILTDDFVIVDHRPASFGELTADGFVDILRASSELVEHMTTINRRYVELEQDVALSEIAMEAVTIDGAELNWDRLVVTCFRDNKVSRQEYFPIADVDAARRRFEELRATGARLENLATRSMHRWAEYLLANDWDRYAALHTPDCFVEDKRKGVRATQRGPEEILTVAKGIAELDPAIKLDVVAIRGDRLALLRLIFPGDYHIEAISVCEVDADGRFIGRSQFDPENIVEAFVELDERFIVGEGSPYREVVEVLSRVVRVVNSEGRIDEVGHAEDVVIIDHRPASVGEIHGRDALIEWVQALNDLSSRRLTTMPRFHQLARDGAVTEVAQEIETAEGSRVELRFLAVSRLRDGQIARIEYFPVERRAEALRRLDEITSGFVAVPLENAYTREFAHRLELASAGDWDAVAEHVAEDAVFEDRRRGFGWTTRGKDALVELARASASGVAVRREVLAIRGERSALQRINTMARDSFEVALLSVETLDEHDLVSRCVWFDVDDLDGAHAELDERYVEGEGAAHADIVRLLGRLAQTNNASDWAGYAACVDEDIVVIDHRPASIGELRGRDRFVEWSQSLGDVSSRRRSTIVRYHSLAASRAVAETLQEIETPDGATAEIRFHAVSSIKDGRVARLDYYAPDALDDALARFDELDEPNRSRQVENAATRRYREVEDALERGEVIQDAWAEDVDVEDRRAGLQHRWSGRAAHLKHIRMILELAEGRPITAQTTTIAVRGERLALIRTVLRVTDPDLETEVLDLLELDENSRFARGVIFDPDDLDRAVAELDELYAQGEGRPYAEQIRRGTRITSAINGSDWETFRDALAEGVRVIDHRPASLGEIVGRDRLVEWARSLRELTTSAKAITIRYHRLDANRAATELLQQVVTVDGAMVELRYHTVSRTIDGLTTSVEYFPVERLDDALARYDELGAEERTVSLPLENACTRFVRLLASDRWEEKVAPMVADAVVDDRRAAVGWKGSWLDYTRAAIPGVEMRTEIIAIRGDRFALSRTHATARDGFEVATLAVHELDEAGRLRASVVLDPDDLDAAFAELDERWLSSDEPAEASRLSIEYVAGFNATDRQFIRARLANDFTFVDRRSVTLMTTANPDEFMTQLEVGWDLLPQIKVRVIAAWSNPVIGVARAEGVDTEGNVVSWDSVTTAVARDGKLVRFEMFDLDRYDDAVARARELESERETAVRIGNAATGALDSIWRAAEAGDWDTVTARTPTEAVVDDRRPGFRNRVTGRTGIVGHAKIAWTGTETHIDHLAIRGDRYALSRQLTSMHDGFEVETFLVYETDAEGGIESSVVFDQTQIDDAYAELDERWLSRGQPTDDERLAMELVRRLNARDSALDRVRLSDDFAFVDRRSVSMNTATGAEAFGEFIRTLWELLPEMRIRVLATRSDPPLGVSRAEGIDTEGNEVTWDVVIVPSVRNGKLVRVEFFDIERYDDAIARARELQSASE